MNAVGTPWPRIVIGNVAVDLVNRESAMSLILAPLSGSEPLAVASANLDHIHHFADDTSGVRRYRRRNGRVPNHCDGSPCSTASRLCEKPTR